MMLLRQTFHRGLNPITQFPAVPRILSTRRDSSSASDDDLHAARLWLQNHGIQQVPFQQIGSVSFSRSSGPGGQHVNTTSSKATLRVPLDTLLDHIPAALHSEIKRSRYVAAKSSTIIIQADNSRKQSDNADSCYKRLYEVIVGAGQHAVPNETSAEQKLRVESL
jgi:peptidyl-tRNA hydrolase ICT1